MNKFDENFSALLNLSKSIIQMQDSLKLKLSSGKNPILTRLEKYIKTYDRTESKDHHWHFLKIYKENKPAILRGPERVGWIKDKGIVIQYGEDVGAANDIKIYVSVIYAMACKIKETVAANLKGLPDVDQNQEISFPDEYLLYLYGIFHEITESEEEQSKLAEHIKTLEGMVGNRMSGASKKSRSAASSSSSGSSDQQGNDPISGILGGLMDQMGIKLPEGQKLPTQNDITGMLGTVMNNPQTKNMLGKVMQEMKECNNVGDIFKKVMGNLGGIGIDKAMEDTIQQNLSSMAPPPAASSEAGDQTDDHYQENDGRYQDNDAGSDEDDFATN